MDYKISLDGPSPFRTPEGKLYMPGEYKIPEHMDDQTALLALTQEAATVVEGNAPPVPETPPAPDAAPDPAPDPAEAEDKGKKKGPAPQNKQMSLEDAGGDDKGGDSGGADGDG